MRRAIKYALLQLASVGLLLVLLGACSFVPICCDPSRDPDLDKPLFDDPRNREMDPGTVKTISPPAGQYLVRPSQVGRD